MNRPLLRRITAGCALFGLSITAGILVCSAPTARSDETKVPPSDFSPYVGKDGSIQRPADFRKTFLHIGSFAVASNPDKEVDELHNVYSRPEDIAAFQRDGKFPDGAVLVKEVTGLDGANLTTGRSHWATDVKVWFVMIKDAKGRYPDNPLWGDGWGWALFEGSDPAKNVATDYKTDCRTCHIPARQDDWVYVRGYPWLREKAPSPAAK